MNPVESFTALMAGRGPGPELDVGALAIAAGANPTVDAGRWLRELDRLAQGVDSLDALTHRLFVDRGFAGNTTRYYDPRNALLDQVLDRRLGIPITLSIVCIEVGRRAGIPLEGIGLPGHFLVRSLTSGRYLDAFDGGTLLDLAGCEALFRASNQAGPKIPFGPHLLMHTPKRTILARILQNLRLVYRRLGRARDLEWVLRMRLALPGVGPDDLVELGRTLGHQGRPLDGARFLEARITEWPQHEERLTLAARTLRAQLN